MAKTTKTAKKTKSKLAKEIVEVQVGDVVAPVAEEKPLVLTEVELLKLTKMQALLQLHDARRSILARERADYLAAIDPERKLADYDARITEETKKSNDVVLQYRALIDSINERLGIDLNQYGFDDETGALQKVE